MSTYEIRLHRGTVYDPRDPGEFVDGYATTTLACNALLRLADELQEFGHKVTGGGFALWVDANGRAYTYRIHRS